MEFKKKNKPKPKEIIVIYKDDNLKIEVVPFNYAVTVGRSHQRLYYPTILDMLKGILRLKTAKKLPEGALQDTGEFISLMADIVDDMITIGNKIEEYQMVHRRGL